MSNFLTVTAAGLPAHIANRQPRNTAPLMAPAAAGYPRISVKGGRFTFIKDGEETLCNEQYINLSIVSSISTVSRTFYSKAYDPKAEGAVLPDCYATDGKVPDASAPVKQSASCALCPKNQKGSAAQGTSKACAYKKRLFVWTDFEPTTIYSLDVAAMGLFGDGNAKTQQMNLGVYSKLLIDRGLTDPAVVVTEVEFDASSSVPKLLFKPVDYWNAEEMATIDAIATDCADMIDAQKTIISDQDAAPMPAPAPVATPAPVAAVVAPVPAAVPAQSGRRGAAAAPAPAAAAGRRGSGQPAVTRAAPAAVTPAVVVDSVATEVAAMEGDDTAGLGEFLNGLE